MNKTIALIITATLLIFAFFAGVKYSNSVKNHASWLFEPKEEEVELPDLSQENLEMGAPVDEAGANFDNNVPNQLDNPAAPKNPDPLNPYNPGPATR